MKKKIKINGDKVAFITMKDGTVIHVSELPDSITIETFGFGDNVSRIQSSNASIIQGKNMITGSVITHGGDFHLGDK